MSLFKSLGLDQLPKSDRISLVQELWDSIAAESASPFVSHLQTEELDRRIRENNAAPDAVTLWEVVRNRIAARLLSNS